MIMLRSLHTLPTTADECVIGPSDHGRILTLEEYTRARETPGYAYEIIDGVLNVSPNPSPSHDFWVGIVQQALSTYAAAHPSIANYVSQRCEVVVSGRPGPTRPQPDLGVYCGFTDPAPSDWAHVCPKVVVEVVSPRRERKDTMRNQHLYWAAGGVEEYWIVDPSADPAAPNLIALVRKPGEPEWIGNEVPFGKAHRSRALPGFSLNLKRLRREWSRKYGGQR